MQKPETKNQKMQKKTDIHGRGRRWWKTGVGDSGDPSGKVEISERRKLERGNVFDRTWARETFEEHVTALK